MDIDVFKVIAEKFGWKTSIYEKQEKTSFQKSQEDIKAGRINTYKNSDGASANFCVNRLSPVFRVS